jgi:hypothetical protein
MHSNKSQRPRNLEICGSNCKTDWKPYDLVIVLDAFALTVGIIRGYERRTRSDGTANAAAQWYFTSDDVVLLPRPVLSPQLIIGRLEPAELLALLTKLGPTCNLRASSKHVKNANAGC